MLFHTLPEGGGGSSPSRSGRTWKARSGRATLEEYLNTYVHSMLLLLVLLRESCSSFADSIKWTHRQFTNDVALCVTSTNL